MCENILWFIFSWINIKLFLSLFDLILHFFLVVDFPQFKNINVNTIEAAI